MPSYSTPIYDENGRVVGIACGRSSRRKCSTPGCPNEGSRLCDFTVTRNGKPATCDRPCCAKHSKRVGPNRDYCEVHAREHEKAGK